MGVAEARPCTLGVGCDTAGVCYAAAHGQPERCDARPAEPARDAHVWYRGWEIGYDYQSGFWSGLFWRAYKGGCDLDAPELSAAQFEQVLDEIDAEEDE